MSNTDLKLFDELDEPGVFSGLMTLIGGCAGLFLVVYSAFYGPLQDMHVGLVFVFGLVFTFLAASFTFLIGWVIELVWPLLLFIGVLGALLVAPLYFYFGPDILMEGVSRAFMFG